MPEINIGDTVAIAAKGITVTGKVISASHYGDDGWYIELKEANVPGGYSYWKQGQDGGHIVSVNGVRLDTNHAISGSMIRLMFQNRR